MFTLPEVLCYNSVIAAHSSVYCFVIATEFWKEEDFDGNRYHCDDP